MGSTGADVMYREDLGMKTTVYIWQEFYQYHSGCGWDWAFSSVDLLAVDHGDEAEGLVVKATMMVWRSDRRHVAEAAMQRMLEERPRRDWTDDIDAVLGKMRRGLGEAFVEYWNKMHHPDAYMEEEDRDNMVVERVLVYWLSFHLLPLMQREFGC